MGYLLYRRTYISEVHVKSGPASKITYNDLLEIVRLREECNRMPSEIGKKFNVHPMSIVRHIKLYHEGNHPLLKDLPVHKVRGGFQIFHMQKVENRETNY